MKNILCLLTVLLATSGYCSWVSPAVTSENMIYVSAQLPVNPATGQLITGTIETLTTQTIHNMKSVLLTKGAKLNQIVHTTVYLTDIRDFNAMDCAYSQFFTTASPPTRDVVQVDNLPNGAWIQISCIADLRKAY